MEEKEIRKENGIREAKSNNMEEVSAGINIGASGSGYCPYTEDRTCRTSKGGWKDDQECRECGWRAW